MSLTITHDAALDPQEQFLRTVNTRIAGGGRLTATAKPPMVVVDIREFRSSLPSLLHGRSMQVIPCMLTVADYVLSPNICIERKSVKDLVSSFKNGRLFNQVETMLLHYKNPMLLIEFDQNKAFTLETFNDTIMSSVITPTSQDIQSKLVMLTIAFPKLKIIWSSSPYQTAEIFEELKKNQDEPDPTKAVRIGIDASDNPGEQSFNQTPQDMLRAIPGITGKNLSRITLEVEDMVSLSNVPQERLDELVGKLVGGQIYRFFNKSVIDD
jgi:DNA excision repair protein ERCC-4